MTPGNEIENVSNNLTDGGCPKEQLDSCLGGCASRLLGFARPASGSTANPRGPRA